ncbi:MAG: HIT family protein [Acholeplasmatales bacterium]|nr:HIT family protein [Acholeplasmatales bacterium]
MCIFCKIINGEIPSKKVYEDDDVLAILDISQATKGHTLVMPKKHYANLFEIDNNVYLKVMAKAKELALKITEKENALGCNILNNCNEAAGQSVMHFHVHILPRYKDDDLKLEFIDHSKIYDLDNILKEIK